MYCSKSSTSKKQKLRKMFFSLEGFKHSDNVIPTAQKKNKSTHNLVLFPYQNVLGKNLVKSMELHWYKR